MCGILAEWRRDPVAGAWTDFGRRLDLMTHRGPDGRGVAGWSAADGYHDGSQSRPASVQLGHRRLAIIDLSPGGAQPMRSHDGRYAITYNGEIYNYLELREELRTRHGQRFTSGSDTEVLLAAWETWGEGALDRLDGMYAFVLLDTVGRRLFAVRDPFGIKPLHYTVNPGRVRLASEIRPLLDGAAPTAHVSRLFDYLRWGAVDEGSETLFEGVRQVEPGELMNIDVADGSVRRRRFWRPPSQRRDARTASDWREEFREVFLTTIDRQLRADVPIVTTLSGGLDSSSICGAVRALRPNEEITAFSYIAEGEQSEERWVDVVSAEKRLNVQKIHVDEGQLLEDLPALIQALEQPFGSGSIYAQYKIFEAIGGRGYKVMLDGQGADEILAGYKSFVAYRVFQLLGEGRAGQAASLFGAHAMRDPGTTMMIAQRLARLVLPSPVAMAARRLVGRSLELPFVDGQWLRARGLDPREAEARQFQLGQGFGEVLQHSLESGALPALLRYGDRNAMAFSVENRVPFLSRPLVDLAFTLPWEALISPDGRTKAVLRDSLDGVLPDAIRNRHDKVGFRATEEAWMLRKSAWTRAALADCGDLPFVDRAALEKCTERFLGGHLADGQKLFRLIVFNQWLRSFGVKID